MSRHRRKKVKDDKYERDIQGFITKYVNATGDRAWTTAKVAEWAIQHGLWEQHRMSAIRQLALHLSRAARKVHIRDEDGNKVCYYHPYPVGSDQPMMWEAMDSITVENMDKSKTVRRDGIAGRVVQSVRDLDYFNKHHNPGQPLLFDPDFSREVEEAKHPTEFKDEPPDDDEPHNG